MCVCVCVCVCVCARVCARSGVQRHSHAPSCYHHTAARIRKHTRAQEHTNTHTHTHTRNSSHSHIHTYTYTHPSTHTPSPTHTHAYQAGPGRPNLRRPPLARTTPTFATASRLIPVDNFLPYDVLKPKAKMWCAPMLLKCTHEKSTENLPKSSIFYRVILPA